MSDTKADRLGVVGHAAVDVLFPHLRFELTGGGVVRVAADGQWFDVRTLEPVRFCKARAAIPAGLWLHGADRRCGGGGPNSVMGALRGAPGLNIRYLESTQPDDLVKRTLAFPTVAMRSLDLRPTPWNAVLSAESEKLILKTELEAAPPFDEGHVDTIQWLSDCPWVLINSPKEDPIVDHLVRRALNDAVRLCLVFTGSPAPGCLWGRALPASGAVVGSWDEIPAVMGWEPCLDLKAALQLNRRVADQARKAMVFITMGAEGVLAAAPAGGAIYHVRLQGDLWRTVQLRVQADPTSLAGVGDAFSGALAAYLVAGRSVVGPLAGLPLPAAAAIAGSAAALRWLGFGGLLRVSDFRCVCMDASSAAAA